MPSCLKPKQQSSLCSVTQNLKALGEQDVVNSRHNDVSSFQSSSAILKIEWREEPQSFNAHVQPFLSPVLRRRFIGYFIGRESRGLQLTSGTSSYNKQRKDNAPINVKPLGGEAGQRRGI